MWDKEIVEGEDAGLGEKEEMEEDDNRKEE